MRFSRIFLWLTVLFLLVPMLQTSAQGTELKKTRVLILLDGSSSMAEPWTNGKTRFQQASRIILSLMDSMLEVNSEVEFALRVFGHQYPSQEKNCYDTRREVPFTRSLEGQMTLRLESLHPYGVSPIAYSLGEAAEKDFDNEAKYAYSIILITDGGESCGGDICKVVNELLNRKIFFKPYIVSLVDYAPLREMYKCLGTFLVAGKEPDVPGVIHTIVDRHREGFKMVKMGKPISVIKETAREKIATIPEPKVEVTLKRIMQEVVTVRQHRKARNLKVSKLMVATPALLPVPAYKMPDLLPRKPEIAPAPAPVVRETVAVRPKTPALVRLKTNRKPKKLPILLVVSGPKMLDVPPVTIPKNFFAAREPEVVTPPAPKPAPKPAPVAEKTKEKPKDLPFVKQTEEAKETLLEVLFTDGRGKFYATSPQVVLNDPATGKPVQKFYRTVDASGNPDAQKVTAGTYHLTITGSDKTYLKNVVIDPDKKNRIIVTVPIGSLAFAYSGGTSAGKPVSKYYAVVKRNFEIAPIVKQRCDTMLQYEPGNYHIEINTLPVTVYSVDLFFGVTIVLPIPEPGTLRVNNTNSLGKVQLYYPLGDRFVRFYTLNVPGVPASQTVELKPGIYEAHYPAGAPGLPEKVLTFHVYSNAMTELELK